MDNYDIKKVFATKLKELREEMGLSQTQLADKLGVSRGSISFYENQDRMAGIDFIYKAALFFDCSTDYLLGINEFKNIQEKINEMEQIKAMAAYLEGLPSGEEIGIYLITRNFFDSYLLLENYNSIKMRFLRSLIVVLSDIKKIIGNFAPCHPVDKSAENIALLEALSSEKKCVAAIERLYRLFEAGIKGYEIVYVESGTILNVDGSSIQLNDDAILTVEDDSKIYFSISKDGE